MNRRSPRSWKEDELSARERRKLEHRNSILERQEEEQLIRTARRIVKTDPSKRTREDSKFMKKYPSFILEAEERREAKLLEQRRQEELFDDADEIQRKSKFLAEAIRSSKHVIVFTGAGVSTAADIPDYRGPNGLWTRQERGQPCIDPEKPFDITKAVPTYTHMALVGLEKAGLIHYIVSQNCDGLHVRSGYPREKLSEIHGNMYLEMCSNCEPETEYFRSFDLTHKTRWRRHRTGRQCHKCGEDLQDTIVLFGEKSRTECPMYWESAVDNVKAADLVICLGTSLKVLKDYPSLWNPKSRLFIVNLQWTPKDDVCELKIHGRCDEVMHLVMDHLKLIPSEYNPAQDPLLKLSVPLRKSEPQQSVSHNHEKFKSWGWFGQGIHGLTRKQEPHSSRKKRKCE